MQLGSHGFKDIHTHKLSSHELKIPHTAVHAQTLHQGHSCIKDLSVNVPPSRNITNMMTIRVAANTTPI